MFTLILVVLLVSVSGRDGLEPQFQVLTPDELMVEVPHYEDTKLVTFRIGIRRKDHEQEDLELGENVINNNRIFIYNERLDLEQGDVVNYLLAFKDKEGYRAQTGRYVFDGVYFKKPFGRRQRFRRNLPTTTDKPETSDDATDSEEFNPIDSRFGGHGRRYGHQGFYPNQQNHFHAHHGPPYFGPQFPNYPAYGPPNHYGPNCYDHPHDLCHNQNPQKWQGEGSSENPIDVSYHCRICNGQPSTTEKPTTTEFADIDIRFSDK